MKALVFSARPYDRRYLDAAAAGSGQSFYAVAEFAVGLMLALNRKIHRAYNRVREGNRSSGFFHA